MFLHTRFDVSAKDNKEERGDGRCLQMQKCYLHGQRFSWYLLFQEAFLLSDTRTSENRATGHH